MEEGFAAFENKTFLECPKCRHKLTPMPEGTMYVGRYQRTTCPDGCLVVWEECTCVMSLNSMIPIDYPQARFPLPKGWWAPMYTAWERY